MAAGPLPLAGAEQELLRHLPLRSPAPPGLAADLVPVAGAADLVHLGVDARRVLPQEPLHLAGLLQHRAQIGPRQQTQGGKDPLQGRGQPVPLRRSVRVRLGQVFGQSLAQAGQALRQRPLQGGDEEGELLLLHGPRRLHRGQKDGDALHVQRPGLHRRPGQGHHRRAALCCREGARPAKSGRAVQSLPLGQIPVVQQPLRRPGQLLPPRRPGRGPLIAPPDSAQGGPDLGGHPPGGDGTPPHQSLRRAPGPPGQRLLPILPPSVLLFHGFSPPPESIPDQHFPKPRFYALPCRPIIGAEGKFCRAEPLFLLTSGRKYCMIVLVVKDISFTFLQRRPQDEEPSLPHGAAL